MSVREVRYFTPDQIRAIRPPGSVHPRVEVADWLVVLNARLKRIFPLSHPDRLISIQDGAGKEVGILTTVEGLDDDTRAIFLQELDRRYFTPVIEAIEHLRQDAGMWHFVVRTQRGPTEFYVRNWRDNAHEIAPGRWHIHTVDGGRFDIPNLEALDAHSRKQMARLL